jgi:hypothetical protein
MENTKQPNFKKFTYDICSTEQKIDNFVIIDFEINKFFDEQVDQDISTLDPQKTGPPSEFLPPIQKAN